MPCATSLFHYVSSSTSLTRIHTSTVLSLMARKVGIGFVKPTETSFGLKSRCSTICYHHLRFHRTPFMPITVLIQHSRTHTFCATSTLHYNLRRISLTCNSTLDKRSRGHLRSTPFSFFFLILAALGVWCFSPTIICCHLQRYLVTFAIDLLKNQFLIWWILLYLQIQFIVLKYKSYHFQHLFYFIQKSNVLVVLRIWMIQSMPHIKTDSTQDSYILINIFIHNLCVNCIW